MATAASTPALAQDQQGSFGLGLGQIVVTGQPAKGIEITGETLTAKAIDTFGRVTTLWLHATGRRNHISANVVLALALRKPN